MRFFKVAFKNCCIARTLHNEHHKIIQDLRMASLTAEEQYGNSWVMVYDGHETMSREEYVSRQVADLLGQLF